MKSQLLDIGACLVLLGREVLQLSNDTKHVGITVFNYCFVRQVEQPAMLKQGSDQTAQKAGCSNINVWGHILKSIYSIGLGFVATTLKMTWP